MIDCYRDVYIHSDVQGELIFIAIRNPQGKPIEYRVTSWQGYEVHDLHRQSWSYSKRYKHRYMGLPKVVRQDDGVAE